MRLVELLKSTEVLDTRNLMDIDIEDIVFDSRKSRDGCIFACIRGAVTDGHSYAPQAVSQGTPFILVEEFLDLPVIQILVRDSRKALGEIATRLFNRPS